MSNKTSVNNAQSKHLYVTEANKASETAIEWATAKIVRTPQGMKKGIYPPDRVQIFREGICTYDSNKIQKSLCSECSPGDCVCVDNEHNADKINEIVTVNNYREQVLRHNNFNTKSI